MDNSEHADADAFFDLVERAMADHEADPVGVLSQWVEDRYTSPPATTDEGVHVMTIHRAKGLEFDTVIIPGMGNGLQRDKTIMMNWMERFHGLLVAPIEYEGDKALSRYLSHLHYEKSEHEQNRLLYVAVTRARQRLYMTGCGRVKKDDESVDIEFKTGSFLNRLKSASPELITDAVLRVPDFSVEESDVQSDTTTTFRRLRSDSKWPMSPPSVDWVRRHEDTPSDRDQPNQWVWREDDEGRRIGIVTHAVLERIANRVSCLEGLNDVIPAEAGIQIAQSLDPRLHGDDKLVMFDKQFFNQLFSSIPTLLHHEGISDEALSESTEKVMGMMEATLADERGQWILHPHPESACEVKLSGLMDGTMVHAVVDRTFVIDDVRWIIDYKTAMPNGQSLDLFIESEWNLYRPQLEAYAALYRAMEPTRPTRLGLYFPAIQRWKEWAYEKSV